MMQDRRSREERTRDINLTHRKSSREIELTYMSSRGEHIGEAEELGHKYYDTQYCQG